MFDEILGHADAVVFDDAFKQAHVGIERGKFVDAEGNAAARRRIFRGIGQQIGEQLLQAAEVSPHPLVRNIRPHRKSVPFLLHQRTADIQYVAHKLGQFHFLRRKAHLTALDL